MKLPLKYYGSKILRQKAKPIENITDEIKQLADDMIETMREEKGLGLAAPQVGKSLRIFVSCVPTHNEEKDEWIYPEPTVYINPKLTDPSEELSDYTEACLSIPGVSGEVVRPWSVTIEAIDLEGKSFTRTYEGLEARCIMHENDHINGVLYIDRMSRNDRKKIEPQLQKLKKKFK